MHYLALIFDSVGFGIILLTFPFLLFASLAGLTSEFTIPFDKNSKTIWSKKDSVIAYIITIISDVVFVVVGLQQFTVLKQNINNWIDIIISIIAVIIAGIMIFVLYFISTMISAIIENKSKKERGKNDELS